MLKYILRRLLYLLPTVLGVILITFILFNAAGGDPAVVRLGQHASARSLEEYDEERGLNKPLLMGAWGKTRVYSKNDFSAGAGMWSDLPGLSYTNRPSGRLILEPGNYSVPLIQEAFKDNSLYRCVLRYRPETENVKISIKAVNETGLIAEEILRTGTGTKKAKFIFETDRLESLPNIALTVEGGRLQLLDMSFNRSIGNFFDSQFLFFLKQIATFDFGRSDATNQRVSDMLLEGILPSLALTVPIFVIELILAIVISLICAFFRDQFIDRFLVIISVVLMSVSYLVWIIGGQYFLSYRLGWFPIWGFESMRYLLLPVVIGVLSGLGGSIRFYRTVMLDEMYKDFVRTAIAKGVGRGGILFRHVLKNAMIPILTSVVTAIPFLYTGSLLLKSFFGIPGLGRMSFNAINSSDFDVIKA
ncbi:MAG: ABC transporter permease, partial [Lentisphaerae bacterium]|nr:ABC transporter permease [Lentisphaerota bacterium]